MSWKVTFFDKKVEDETLGFPAGILANLLHVLEMIEEFGPAIGKPHTAPMGEGLYEIRAKGKVRNRTVIVLHYKRKRGNYSSLIY